MSLAEASPLTDIDHLKLSERYTDFTISKKVIGSGAFGTVTTAKKCSNGKQYAVKLCPKAIREYPEQMYDIVNELKVHCSLHHKYVIRMFGFIDHGENIHMFMEFAVNGDLSNYMKLHDVPSKLCARIVYQVSSALMYIHGMNIIHRDLKPGNLLLDGNFHIRVADFGLSVANTTGMRSTMCGTYYYMSPELFDDIPRYNESVDVWSLGIIIFELSVKRLPFVGYTRNDFKRSIQRCFLQKPFEMDTIVWKLIKNILVRNPNGRLSLKEVKGSEYVRQFSKKEADKEPIHEKKADDHGTIDGLNDKCSKEKEDSDEKHRFSINVAMAHKDIQKTITDFNTLPELFKKLCSAFEISEQAIAFVTVNTDKVDVQKVFEGRLKETDCLVIHLKETKAKTVQIVKKAARLEIVLTDNGIGGSIVKQAPKGSPLKEGDLINSVNGQSMDGKSVIEVAQVFMKIDVGTKMSVSIVKPKKMSKAQKFLRHIMGSKENRWENRQLTFKGAGKTVKLELHKSDEAVSGVNDLVTQYFGVDNTQMAEEIWDGAKMETTCCGLNEKLKSTMGPVDIPEIFLERMLHLTQNEKFRDGKLKEAMDSSEHSISLAPFYPALRPTLQKIETFPRPLGIYRKYIEPSESALDFGNMKLVVVRSEHIPLLMDTFKKFLKTESVGKNLGLTEPDDEYVFCFWTTNTRYPCSFFGINNKDEIVGFGFQEIKSSSSDNQPGFLPTIPSTAPEEMATVLCDFNTSAVPEMTHWQHPHFLDSAIPGRSVTDAMAELIVSHMGSPGFIYDTFPNVFEMDVAMLNWAGRAIGLPEQFLFNSKNETCMGGGSLQESVGESTLCTLMTARCTVTNRLLVDQGKITADECFLFTEKTKDDTEELHIRVYEKLCVYASADAHPTVAQQCHLAMLRHKPIEALPQNGYGITAEQVETMIQRDMADGMVPCCIIVTLGTKGIVSSDQLEEIGRLAQHYECWLHVEASTVSSFWFEPKYRPNPASMVYASSVLCMLPFHSTNMIVVWTRDQKSWTNGVKIAAQYLKPTKSFALDVRDWTIHLSPDFRSLKMWFNYRLMGLNAMRLKLKNLVSLAERLERKLAAHNNIRIFGTRVLNSFCFQYYESGMTMSDINKYTRMLGLHLNESGRVYVGVLEITEWVVLSASVSVDGTTKSIIDGLYDEMDKLIRGLASKKGDGSLLRHDVPVSLMQ